MGEQDFVSRVKYIIASKYDVTPNDIYAVWLCKTLQNNKGLFSTDIEDGKYYEATYNGDKDELYLDTTHIPRMNALQAFPNWHSKIHEIPI